MKKQFRDFESAREFVRKLGLKSNKEWREYCKSGNNPEDISRAPDLFYKNKGWINWGDFLGTGKIATQQRNYDSYEKVKIFAQKLGLKSNKEWREYCKSGNMPDKVPKSPEKVYKDEWKGWGDFLGTGHLRGQHQPFAEAREFVRSLGLKTGKEWYDYCKSGNKPIDIPTSPKSYYKKEWKGMGDWLGTGKTSKRVTFKEAREFVRSLKFKGVKEWQEYCKSGNKPNNLPSSPQNTYKNKGWKGWGDFLGSGNVATFNREYLEFKEAREFVRKLKISSSKEWQEYCKSGNKPDDIPYSLEKTYKKEWTTWGDFLGTGTVASFNMIYQPFKEARQFVRKLGLKTGKEWREYCKSGNKPDDIPSNPHNTYKKEYVELGDWLGTGRTRKWMTFNEARDFVRSLGLNSVTEWKQYCKSGNKPNNLPYSLEKTYKKEWTTWGDFLGTGTVASFNMIYQPFKEARQFVRKLKLKGTKDWYEYCKSGNKPDNISSNPHLTYKKEWKNYGDWLGTGTVAARNKQYRSFAEARDFVRSLGLKTRKEWNEYSKSGNKPDDIPANPWDVYKEWNIKRREKGNEKTV